MEINTGLVFLLLCLSVLLLPPGARGEEAIYGSDPVFRETWQAFTEICDEALPYAANDERQEKSVFELITFREPKYVRLLKEAQEVLGVSEATEKFQEIEELRKENSRLEQEITGLKRDRVMAPESSYNPLAQTKRKIDKSIAGKSSRQAANIGKIGEIRTEVRDILSRHGLDLDENELDYFLIAVEGDELIHLMTVADNMKRIQQIIARELTAEPDNLELARMYTGMYLIALDAYLSAHDPVMSHLEEYRTRLKGIAEEAKNNYREAQKLRRNASQQEYAFIDTNMELNNRTIEIAAAYDSLLQRRIQNLAKSRQTVRHRADIARNTHRTLTNGSALVALVSESSNEYALLMNFEMPELEVIYDTAMLDAFRGIAEKIKNEMN